MYVISKFPVGNTIHSHTLKFRMVVTTVTIAVGFWFSHSQR